MRLEELKDMTKDDLLERIGLQTRSTLTDYLLPAAGIFGAGLLVGAGLGLLFAPKSGREIREDIRHRLPGDHGERELEAERAGALAAR